MSQSSTAEPSPHPLPQRVSEIFDPLRWRDVAGFANRGDGPGALTDVTYHRGCERDANGAWVRDLPVVRVALDRPELRNAFRPHTVDELYRVLDHARMSGDVGAVILTGNGPSPKDGGWGFCSGGDQRVRGRDGYLYEKSDDDAGATSTAGADAGTSRPDAVDEAAAAAPTDNHDAAVAAQRERLDAARAGRLHILEVQRLIRTMPKVVIAAVSGWAAGGGHSLNVVCDLSLASAEHARFKQTDADVGSFDAGYGSALLARQVGDKRAREIFFLARTYDAATAERWGVVNEAVPHAELEERALEYARIVAGKSPQAIRMLKYAFNLADDGLAGQQVFAGEATRLAYMTDEAAEGRDAFLERRKPDWSPFPYYF
ncbi:1,4-dihydroxy-2-naphthoyl-CoA synthase [Actinomyces succiniciruminis]|uniref:1,4-dihydroxy-2-naphthoyl-CoA synthase n=1 Tax=Actinomyces succiniciruminis TaxID=1522002 RepID=A0A1L7R894_9ACTO|nr:1,4-dihydroxy-2-naphthoyl-CoA synthase [Actinomyces succiniciruminis]CED90011.1 1,4-Dihydroxy-2-naphthoyl-CoA synthase [Actinomyces succiniciruminis]